MDRTKLIIAGAVGGLLIIGLLFYFVFSGFNIAPTQQAVTLQMWGVFDDSSYYEEAIRGFQQQYPNVQIIYKQFNFQDYEQQLINSFAAGTGPDIWLMHNTWLAKHADLIQPLPQAIPAGQKVPLMTIKDFQDQFVDVAYRDLVHNGQIYGLPLYVDTLALYYNKDLFNTAGITRPPTTYDELNSDVAKLTILDDQNGSIKQAGISLGTARNINRSTDILSLLMMQSGVQMTDSDNTVATFAGSVNNQKVGEVALQYYTDFANPAKQVFTWNAQQPYSIDAFVNGESAMMVNYSHHIATIRSKSARFNFGIAPMPQITGTQTALNYADYWAPTVARQSKNPLQAWRFLTYLSSARGATPYLTASNRPAARRDIIERQKTDPDLSAFATQALTARSWYQVDDSAIENILADMIEAVNFGRSSIADALKSAENQVSILMSKAPRLK